MAPDRTEPSRVLFLVESASVLARAAAAGHTAQVQRRVWCSRCLTLRAARPGSGVLPVRALKLEEVGHLPVLALLLVEEVERARVEGVEPLLPRNRPQPLTLTPAELKSQHPQMVPVLGPLHCGRHSVPRLRPTPDDLV